jgi:hypothetical protein
MYGIAVVPSASHALRGEKILLRAGIQVKLIPTPRQLSSNCGTALRFLWEQHEQVAEILKNNGIILDSLVELEP